MVEQVSVDSLSLMIVEGGSTAQVFAPGIQVVELGGVRGGATTVSSGDRGLRMASLAIYSFIILCNKDDPRHLPPNAVELGLAKTNNPNLSEGDTGKNASVCLRLLYLGYLKTIKNG